MFYKTTYLSPLGNIMIAGDGKSVSGVWLEGQKYFADTVLQDMKEKDHGTILNVASIGGFMPGPLMATYYA